MKTILLIMLAYLSFALTTNTKSLAKERPQVDFKTSVTILHKGYSGGGTVEIQQIGGNADKVRVHLNRDKITTITVDRGDPGIILSEPWNSQVKDAISRLQKGK